MISSRQANQASIRKDTQARFAELKGVALITIPYPRSNAILTQYQEEIRNLENKANYHQEIDSIDKLADWLAGPEKGYKPKKLDPVPITMDEWIDKHLWLGKEDPIRHANGSITWFSKRKPKLAPRKLNKHGKEYWKLSPDANKPHISSEYTKKVQDLMNDKEDYIIGIANDWEMGRMELRIQNDNNGTITGSKEEWIPGEKDKWGMEPHGWSPYMIAYCERKININRLLRLDQIEWRGSPLTSQQDIEDGAKEKWEGRPYILRYQFMACSHQSLFGPKINEDGIVCWHTQLPVRVNFKMVSEIKILLHYATEYTLFTKIWMDNGAVEEGIADNGWHFGKKKKAGSLTGEEITPGQLMGIDEYLWEKTREYVSHICYELRPVPIPQGPPYTCRPNSKSKCQNPKCQNPKSQIIISIFCRNPKSQIPNTKLQRQIEQGGTKRAKGLTPARERALKKKAGSLTGEEITPGQLMGIDEYLWEKTREYVSHICYELRPVPIPQGPPYTCRPNSKSKCQNPKCQNPKSQIIISIFCRNPKSQIPNTKLQRQIEQGGTKRAKGLTPARERALVEFNEKVLKPGCNLKDLHILKKNEKDGGLGMKIIVKDILGNEMWNSGKYKKHSTLTVFCHNNHAWTGGISEMPKISSICGIDLECERALASACTKTKEGKVNIDDKKIAEALISFIARELPKATRAFEYKKSQFIPEELLKWGPVDIREWMEGGYYHFSAPIPLQELKAEYNELEKFLGGAQSYRFRCWREREGIEPTPRNAVEIWQQSQVESMVWNALIIHVPKIKNQKPDLGLIFNNPEINSETRNNPRN
ncbi:hypothetical protein Glove_772g20 [Diversispora epigaea]|uniref:Uncharacterized protein n=1 Tax=Diversispora epigaea TaxID=1348612 RepID=A0A397FZZ7_9GLOM|nr:hypothetical protein Glove_772g20 [Diversispora epigaea]